MDKYTIKTKEEALAAADKIATLMQQLTALSAQQEAEKNAIDVKYQTMKQPLDDDCKELLTAFKKALKKQAMQAALFDADTRHGHSTLATFGYRDSAPKLCALQGSVKDAVARLYASGNTKFLIVGEPKVDISEDKLKEAELGTGALADMGFCYKVSTNFYLELNNGEATPATRSKA